MTTDAQPIVGVGDRWLCPDCGRVIDKPPYLGRTVNDGSGDRFHSWRCARPMVRCVVTTTGETA